MSSGIRKTIWRYIGWSFLLLLVVSNGYRLISGVDNKLAWNHKTLSVQAEPPESQRTEPVRLAYRESNPNQHQTAIVLLHGTPMAGISFNAITPALTPHFRVLAPDMPGFGGSSLHVPDYSVRSHAAYLKQFLDQLNLKRVHLVAYSQGGGVALELYQLAPEYVASMTMLSSIGVQELELLGDYHLNHAVYAAQLGIIHLVQWLTPHFGYFDDALLNIAYARNVYDTDQRPLRDILKSFQPPALIIQGKDDGLVPYEAAAEHHRLMPHSELVEFAGGHGLVFTDPEMIAEPIISFVKRVEQNAAATRRSASQERLQQSASPFGSDSALKFKGITLVVAFLLLIFATYVSEDLTCIAAGLLVARGSMELMPAVSACLIGIYTGDLLLFLAGKKLGRPALKRAPLKWFVKQDSLQRSAAWFDKQGPWVIFVSRFIPGTRLPTYLTAGLLNMSFTRFSFYFLLASLIWTPTLVIGAKLIGEPALELLAQYKTHGWIAGLILVVALGVIFKLLVPMFSHRGRRLLYSSWQRKLRWEFWPPWLFYPPLMIYILYLGVRHRGFSLFTASNPAMPDSGFVGESKVDILDGFTGADEYIAAYRAIPPGPAVQREQQLLAFMEQHQLDFPVVLKPNVGERGRDVAIVRTLEQGREWLEANPATNIVQAFAPGQEFGVFYYRYPDEEKGHIFAITDKQPVSVTGDGKRTLEQLILDDDRAVFMARFFLSKFADRLFTIPEPREQIALVEVGTHCLGCMFLDGEAVYTDELAETIDHISKTYEGFYFGRYDIRTPDIGDFRNGSNFKIVELNGVTSEATSIYDPKHGLLFAYRKLMKQWRIAFEIGAQNRAHGHLPTPPGTLLMKIWRSFRQQESTPDSSPASLDAVKD